MENRKLKIAFLSFYSGEVQRGVETHTHNLSNHLITSGHKVVVYQNGPKLKDSLYKTVSIDLRIDWNKKSYESIRMRIPFADYWSKLIGRFTKVVLGLLDDSYDIIIPTNGSLQSLYCKLWSTRHKAKLVIIGHSGPGIDDRWNLFMFPKVFVGLTNSQVKWAKSVNPFVKSVRISNGVSCDKYFKSKGKIEHNLPSPIVLSVGALTSIKRHHLAIKAMCKLNEGSLVIAGKGDLEKELHTLGKDLLPGRFKIVDVPHAEMPALYKSSDLFVFSSFPWESFGIVLLEAMASDLPIVASDDTIRREIIGDAGLFVDVENSEDYAEAIKKAMQMNWRNKPIKQAEKYDWSKISNQYEKLFYKLI